MVVTRFTAMDGSIIVADTGTADSAQHVIDYHCAIKAFLFF